LSEYRINYKLFLRPYKKRKTVKKHSQFTTLVSLFISSTGIYNYVASYTSFQRAVNKLASKNIFLGTETMVF